MLSLFAALLIVTASTQPDTAALGLADNRASQAYAKCEQDQSAKLAAATPEAAAKIILSACAPEREARERARDEFNSAMFTPDVVAELRADSQSQRTEKRIAATIRLQRANSTNQNCIKGEIEKLAATVAPEAGAATVFKACAAQRHAALKARVAWLEASSLKDEWQMALIKQYKAAPTDKNEIAVAKKEIADAIRKQRGGTPAAAQ
ncbi:MAG TPA: hypothetical protein VGB59_04910 [Allosphingosinicella sp.]|jgi:hypothetical protein